ncbi:2-C-methyl-D-erythritol 4-phosphate cytidylyltransferase [Galbitalea sp. SE-J8]|uniref:2-C-methyl-D-erythritol 4-phosphate cytidylyltransferase n=1 Tax=Galbitalea sp. SE-J8 TaxID=3054952 RepID=UPI00259D25DE|nr:2-C-methyl-D-erythritol 4-phosphate cytidylyltransferase [Galbitalea sp. SE-J8]MDM4763755.1 2-C-methyl-D-erythritol 4-phosphate cytidylyltransferase [Galbitalea sp. SE-J8]
MATERAGSVPRVAVVLVGAGSGVRLRQPVPKAFVPVRGIPLLAHAVEPIAALAEPVQLVVVAPAARLDEAAGIVREHGAAIARVDVVPGGDTRTASVAAGIARLAPEIEVVLVHDAARAFTPTEQFARVIAAVRAERAGVVPAQPVTDTVKRVDWTGAVEQTLDRASLVAVQTPQGFPRAELVAAYATDGLDYTDDAALFAAAGHRVVTVEGDPLAHKITTPEDLGRAELLGRSGMIVRTGIGVDVHAYDDASPLWLGGLYWPDEPGLSGHSDGDALSHAVCDALLSAAGLGDLGSRFGTSDPRFAGAHADVFIAETVALVDGAGFEIVNVAVQVIANRPKVAARRLELEARLTELVGAPVSVSATTSDGLGFAGRGEGLTAIATASVRAS